MDDEPLNFDWIREYQDAGMPIEEYIWFLSPPARLPFLIVVVVVFVLVSGLLLWAFARNRRNP